MKRENQIKAGPSKFDLSVALFYTDNTKKSHRQTVNFNISGPSLSEIRRELDIDVIVEEVGRDSASDAIGEAWLIKGYLTTDDAIVLRASTYVTIIYRTDNRTGTIVIDNRV